MRRILTLGAAMLVAGVSLACQEPAQQPSTPAADDEAGSTIEELKMEVERLKSIAPTQSHVMADAAIQAGSLWFAGQQKNWTLATFYLNETRGRIRWMIRINPKPKVSGSEELVDLQGIFDGIDTGVLTPLKQAIDEKDSAKFAANYRLLLESCYACHKSAGRPYLRPMIPAVPPQPIINPNPAATWPS